MKESTLDFKVHKLIWLFVIFFPVLPGAIGANLAQQLMHFCFLGFFALICLWKKRLLGRKTLIYIAIIVFGFVLYYTACTLFLTSRLGVRDFTDLVRPIIYASYVVFAFLVPIPPDRAREFFTFLCKVLIFQLLFSALVYVPAVWPVVDLFKGRTSDDMALHFFRWSGTYVYPSDFSFFLSFFIFYYYSAYCKRIAISGRGILLLILTGCGLLLTFSRGGIFSTMGVLGLLYWFTDAKRRLSSYVIIAMMFILLALIIYFGNGFQQVSYVFDLISAEGEVDSSVGHRFREIDLAIEYAIKYPPFGMGSNRLELAGRIDVIESFYGFHFIKWGILGFLAALAVKLMIIKISFSVSRIYRDNIFVSSIGFAVALLTLSEILFFGFSSAITDRFKCLPTYYLLVGYVVYWNYLATSQTLSRWKENTLSFIPRHSHS